MICIDLYGFIPKMCIHILSTFSITTVYILYWILCYFVRHIWRIWKWLRIQHTIPRNANTEWGILCYNLCIHFHTSCGIHRRMPWRQWMRNNDMPHWARHMPQQAVHMHRYVLSLIIVVILLAFLISCDSYAYIHISYFVCLIMLYISMCQ
jgi:hypothetical protein